MGENQHIDVGRTDRGQSLTLSVSGETVALRTQLREAWAEIQALRRTVAHQARLLENLHAETHSAAPSVNAIYFLFAPTRWHEPSWRLHWQRLQPSLRGLGTMPAPEVNAIAWNRHVTARRHEEQRGGGTPCEGTLNTELARLKGMFAWAVENQVLPFNPLQGARRFKTRDQRETRLTPQDVDHLLLEAESLRDHRLRPEDDDGLRSKLLQASALCWFDSMMRVKEARHIKRSQIQPNGDYRIPREHTKTDSGERTVTLTARTLEAIGAIPSHPDSDYVFVNPRTGKLLSYHTLRRWFRWTCKEARLDAKAAPRDKRICQHMIRHAGATAADAAGVRLGALSTVLGHASSRSSARYIHREGVESAHHVADAMASLQRRETRRRK